MVSKRGRRIGIAGAPITGSPSGTSAGTSAGRPTAPPGASATT
ncbi:hypothetical protein [Actinomadura sp. SCN-SB]